MSFVKKRGRCRLLLCLTIFFLLPQSFLCAEEVGKTKIKLSYTFYLDSIEDDCQGSKNSFVWSLTSLEKSNKVKDKFDAVTGASTKNSSRDFAQACRNSAKKRIVPAGLYSLMLYAVSKPSLAKKDLFTLKESGKKLTISFTHRKRSFMIESNDKGIIDLSSSFKILEKTESEDSQDLEEAVYMQDTAEAACEEIYTGKLKASFNNKTGLLKIKGTLTLTKVEKEKAEEESQEKDTENPLNPPPDSKEEKGE